MIVGDDMPLRVDDEASSRSGGKLVRETVIGWHARDDVDRDDGWAYPRIQVRENILNIERRRAGLRRISGGNCGDA